MRAGPILPTKFLPNLVRWGWQPPCPEKIMPKTVKNLQILVFLQYQLIFFVGKTIHKNGNQLLDSTLLLSNNIHGNPMKKCKFSQLIQIPGNLCQFSRPTRNSDWAKNVLIWISISIFTVLTSVILTVLTSVMSKQALLSHSSRQIDNKAQPKIVLKVRRKLNQNFKMFCFVSNIQLLEFYQTFIWKHNW